MKALMRDEISSWCGQNGIPLNDRRLPAYASDAERFEIPGDAQKRVVLVAARMQALRRQPALALWFDDWAVWPSGQRMHVFDRFRLSYGEARSLAECPGHIFNIDEIEDAISFATLAVLFLWDCHVLSPTPSTRVFFSHDEWGVAQNGEGRSGTQSRS